MRKEDTCASGVLGVRDHSREYVETKETETMVQKIEKDGVLYAIILKKDDWEKGLNFLTPEETFIQAGTFWYQKGKRCNAHRHIPNERPNSLTQECNIILSGSLRARIYDMDGRLIYHRTLRNGDLIIVLKGGHGYEILEDDTRVVECKNGPFVSVEKDKRPI